MVSATTEEAPRPSPPSPARLGLGAVFRPARAARSGELLALADEVLMQRAAGGELDAFAVIFDRHATAAFSLAYRICRRRAMAEDVVQEAFLSLWRNGARYEPSRGSVRSLLLSVTHNRAIDALRRAQVSECRSVADAQAADRVPASGLTDSEVLSRDDARRVHDALEELPPEQRRVIELAYFGGLTHVQIAEALALPAGTVKGRMRLGLRKLRIVLDPII